MVAAVVVVWIVLSILVGLTTAPLRRPNGIAPLRRPSSLHPSSVHAPPAGSVRR